MTDWTIAPSERLELGMLVTPEEADALAEIGENVPAEQIGDKP